MKYIRKKVFLLRRVKMILASAIKYYIETTDEFVILCGARHGDIFTQLEKLGFRPREGYDEIEQGFIDHKNNFLNREEAYEHAKMCGQLCEKIQYEKEKGTFVRSLISEDLW
jgi:hypothetical protein